jgi:selT/selW/selH-like putative selenoprotein
MQYFGEDLENVNLITGSKGEFEVFANGELIFSKTQSGRFPDWKGDLLTPLKARAPLKAEAKT